MARLSRGPCRRCGIAAMELAVLFPVVLSLLVGIWEVGRLVQIHQILDNAAREGARQASTGLKTEDDVELAVCQYLKDAGLPDYTSTPDSVVTVTDVTSPGTDPSGASYMDQLHVTVSIPFKDVRWSALNLVTGPNTKLNADAFWNSQKDQTYPTAPSVPNGF